MVNVSGDSSSMLWMRFKLYSSLYMYIYMCVYIYAAIIYQALTNHWCSCSYTTSAVTCFHKTQPSAVDSYTGGCLSGPLNWEARIGVPPTHWRTARCSDKMRSRFAQYRRRMFVRSGFFLFIMSTCFQTVLRFTNEGYAISDKYLLLPLKIV